MTSEITRYAPDDLEQLVEWLKQQLDEGAVRLVLRQRAERGEPPQVREWAVSPNQDPEPLAADIYRRAQQDARFSRGRTMYGVFAYREGDRSWSGRHCLIIDGEEGAQGFFEQAVERPDVAGLLGQLMRHNEANARMSVGQQLDLVAHYKDMLQTAQGRIEQLEAKLAEQHELYEQLTTLKHQRDLEVRQQDREDKRQDFLIEKLDVVTPVLLSKMAPGAATKTALGEELIRGFLKSLKPAQIAGILSHLQPEQAAAINEIYATYGEREMAREKAKAAQNGASSSPNGTSNGVNH